MRIFIEFCLVGSLIWVFKLFYYHFWSTVGVILCIIIKDVHQFIGHWLISLYPWYKWHLHCLKLKSKTFLWHYLAKYSRFVDLMFNWTIIFISEGSYSNCDMKCHVKDFKNGTYCCYVYHVTLIMRVRGIYWP